MTELRLLVERAKAGDRTAFEDLVQRNQGWVTGCAVVLLGDYQLAEDAVQEAFAAAHASLRTLDEPEAFPGWLKSIVRHTCIRVLRKHRPNLVSLDLAADLPSDQPEPEWFAEAAERRHEVLAALATLPDEQCQVVLLHYWREYSHREIAALLGIAVTTVNNRLHAARTRLREEIMIMTENVNRNAAASPLENLATGTIVATYGPIAEVKFTHNRLPPLRGWLVLSGKPDARRSLLVVVQYLRDGVARAVAVSNGTSLKPGLEVVDAGAEVAAPIDAENLRKAVRELVRLTRVSGPTRARVETGIKAIDLFCPLADGDVVGLAAGPGVGEMVLIQELLYRRATRSGRLTLIAPIQAVDPVYAPGDFYGIGDVQIVYLPLRDMSDPPAGFLDPVDARVALSLPLARIGMWPSVDPNASSSKHLDVAIVGAEHVETATRTRDLLRRFPPEQEGPSVQEGHSAEDQTFNARARRLRRFLTQPLYVAAPWIRWPAAFVSIADTLRGCRGILDGAYDSLPEEAFYMANTMEEVVERANAG